MNKILVFVSVWIFLLSVSCQSVKQSVGRKNLPPPITENRLFKHIEENCPDFNTLYAKRIDVRLLDGKGKSRSFKASLKISRDSFIQINANAPLGIEIGRVLLTRDSIRIIDTYHKKYFLADYGFFSRRFDLHVDYHLVEDILTNTFFEFDIYGPRMKKHNFKLDRNEAGYELSNLHEKALSRKVKKIYKKKRKNKDYMLILEKILIDSRSFRPLQVSVEDMDEFAGIRIRYGDFTPYAGIVFPHSMSFNLFSTDLKSSLGLKFNRMEFNVPVRPSFRISSKYKRIFLPYELQ